MPGLMRTLWSAGFALIGAGLVCRATEAGTTAAEPLLPRLPEIVGETRWPMSLADWETNGRVERVTEASVDGIRWHYQVPNVGAPAQLTLALAADHPGAERWRFMLRGNGSGHHLRLSCFFEDTARWHGLASIPLDFEGWRHLEIPATAPLHRFHRGVTALRLEVVRPAEAAGEDGVLTIANPALITPVLLDLPLQPSAAPAPFFNTWGGAVPWQTQQAAAVGVDLHMVPVGTFAMPLERRVDAAVRRIPEIAQQGLMPGLAFFNNPGREWVAENEHLVARAPDGRIQTRGAIYTSPWHPEARRLWREHIQESLRELRRQGVLDAVRLVMLNPGAEGEVCFGWSTVWAHDPDAVAAWQRYLETLYGSVAAMNRDWFSAYQSFEDVPPPADWYPDRRHAVFTDFYRLSMLRYCVELADAVRSVWQPEYWLWMTHTVGQHPHRFFGARYPLFYIEQLARLGLIDYAHIAILDWQTPADVAAMRRLGVRIIGETDVFMRPDRLSWTFDQAEVFGVDGVFIGAAEVLADSPGVASEVARVAQERIRRFVHKPLAVESDGNIEGVER